MSEELVRELKLLVDNKETLLDTALEAKVPMEERLYESRQLMNDSGIKCSDPVFIRFIGLARRFKNLESCCDILQANVTSLEKRSNTISDALVKKGVSPDNMAAKLGEMLNNAKPGIVLQALRLALPMQLELDKRRKHLDAEEAIDVTGSAKEDDDSMLGELLEKLENPKIKRLSM